VWKWTTFRQQLARRIADLGNEIDKVRTQLVAGQDQFDGNVELKNSYRAAIERVQRSNWEMTRTRVSNHERISDMRVELIALGDQVEGQTDRLVALKGKNDKLQKWRTVMDSRLSDKQRQSKPQKELLVGLKRRIGRNEGALRTTRTSCLTDAQRSDAMDAEVRDLYSRIVRIENATFQCETRIKGFRNRVASVYTQMDFNHWAVEVAEIHRDFVRDVTFEAEDAALADTLTEFTRQKSGLGDRVTALRTKVDGDTEANGLSHLRQIHHNDRIIGELRRIRGENGKLRSELSLAQSSVNALTLQCTPDKRTLETKPIAKRSRVQIYSPVHSVQKRTTRTGATMTVEHFG